MIRQNLERALRAFTRRKPFRPFVLELLTGERWDIVHPEAVTWRGDVLYFVASDGCSHLLDSTSVLQLFQPPNPPAQSQG